MWVISHIWFPTARDSYTTFLLESGAKVINFLIFAKNKKENMRILITNDDGFDSKGIEVLISLAREFSDDIIVVAPDRTYSGMSHSITMHSPLFVERKPKAPKGVVFYICTGSPVDCVKVALDELIKDHHPDLILSGINHGSNSNISVVYSGTMGAATEGAFYGIPSIGLSLTDHDLDADFDAAVYWASQVIRMVVDMPADHKRGICLNVNVPNISKDEIRGMKVCRQTRGNWREDFVARHDPRGRGYYWMSGHFVNAEPQATDTDEWALKNNYVAIVPVQMDFTDYGRIDYLSQCVK